MGVQPFGLVGLESPMMFGTDAAVGQQGFVIGE
jgi:hypothetical protein